MVTHCTTLHKTKKSTCDEQICQINANMNASKPFMFAPLCFLDYVVLVPPGGADKNDASPPLQPESVQ